MRAQDLWSGPGVWAQRLTWATLAGLVLGLIGPFGSYLNDGPLMRVAFWTGMLWAGAIWLGLTVAPVYRLAPRIGVPPTFAAAAATLIACVPLAALGAAASHWLWPLYAHLPAIVFYAQTLFVAAPFVALAIWSERRGRAAPPSEAPASAPPGRLPARLREAALCLQMEDHYVRVHTEHGSELVLTPMHLAIQDIGGERGLRVHRSWWVARHAVERAEPDGRAAVILTRNGLRVPVARSRVADLRAAAWLPPGEL